MSSRTDALANIALAVSAAVAVVVLVSREIRGERTELYDTGSLAARELRAEEVDSLNALAVPNAMDYEQPPTLVEFLDIECPYCRAYVAVIDSALSRHTDQRFAVIHFPLSQHRYAEPGAMAMECAPTPERAHALARVLLENNSSLGSRSFGEYAQAAGIADSARLIACMARGDVTGRIAASRALGMRIGVRGTPALVIGGVLLARPPLSHELYALLDATSVGPRAVKAVADSIDAARKDVR